MTGMQDDDLDILAGLDAHNAAPPPPVDKPKSDDKAASAGQEDKEKPDTKKTKPPVKEKTPSAIGLYMANLAGILGRFSWQRSLIYQAIGAFTGLCLAASVLSYLHLSAQNKLDTQFIPLFNQIVAIPPIPPSLESIKNSATAPHKTTPDQGQKTDAPQAANTEKQAAAHGSQAPFRYYRADASGVSTANKVRIAIVIIDVGLSKTKLNDIFAKAPSFTTLAFSAYADVVQPAGDIAKGKIFENWLVLPTEVSKGQHDPGPMGIFNSREKELNFNALGEVFKRNQAFAGFVLRPYAAFVRQDEQYPSMVDTIFSKGYGIADTSFEPIPPAILMDGKKTGLPYFQADVYLDESLNPDDIAANFRKLEIIAQEGGTAIGVMRPYPIGLTKLAEWASTADDRDVALLPLSALFSDDAASPSNTEPQIVPTPAAQDSIHAPAAEH